MRLDLVPAPVRRRRGWERWAFIFFLIGAASSASNAVANVSLALCLAATIGWRIEALREGRPLLEPFRRSIPVQNMIGIFVALSIVSCIFSTLPARSLWEIKGFATFLLVPFTLAMIRDAEDLTLLIDLWRIAALYMIVRGLWEFLAGADNLELRLTGGMSTYMTYSGLLMIFVLILFARGLARTGTPRSNAFDVGIGLLGAVAVALTLTRNAYLGLGAGILTLLFLIRPRLTLILPLLAVLFFFAMPPAVRDRALSSFDGNDQTMRDRILMWSSGKAMVRDHPLFGVGPGRVKDLYPVYRLPGFINPTPGHLHNNVIMVAAETGLLSAFAYLAFVGVFLRGAYRVVRRAPTPFARAIARGSIAVMIGLFVAGFLEYNFGDVEILRSLLVVSALPFVLPLPAVAGAEPAA